MKATADLHEPSHGLTENEMNTTSTKHTAGTIHMGAGNGEGSIFTDTEGARSRLEDCGTTLYPVAMVNRGWNVDEDDANGRRLVACWNACLGIDTELLECMGAGTFVRLRDGSHEERMRLYALISELSRFAETRAEAISEAARDSCEDSDLRHQEKRAWNAVRAAHKLVGAASASDQTQAAVHAMLE